MQVEDIDIEALLSGHPPVQDELLMAMTLGRDHWLNWIQKHYLANYIADGGSKVKVLVGGPGTGKTHLLRCILQDAQQQNYATVFLSAREYRLNDFVSLYRAIVQQLDTEQLVQGLCHLAARKLGYGQYEATAPLLPYLQEDRGLTRDLAIREVKETVGQVLKDIDFGASFKAFAYSVINNRLIYGNEEPIRLALKWLAGDKLERHQKQATLLFERLNKVNARYWLNALIRLLKLAGLTGLVLAIDELDVMAERHPETRRFLYTPGAIKDTCELFRQMIDDVELLDHTFILLAGRWEMIEDDRRGFKSYEALWMRLQTGLLPVERFNALADIVDTDTHLVTQGKDFPLQVQDRLIKLLESSGYQMQDHPLPDLSEYSPLRARIIEAALQTLEAA